MAAVFFTIITKKDLHNLDKEAYRSYDAVYKNIKSSSDKVGMESVKDYVILDGSIIVPEYFIEYSVERDKNKFLTKFERLSLDIAYSNKLSHSNMPQIIGSLSNHFDSSPVSSNLAN